MKRYDEVVLFDGGLSSFIGYHYLIEVQPIYFNLGTKQSEKITKFFPKMNHKVIVDDTLSFIGKNNVKINGLSLLLYMCYTAFMLYSDNVNICLTKEKLNDKNKIFKEFTKSISYLEDNDKIKITSPFQDMTKKNIVEWFAGRNYKDDLLNTIDCYNEKIDKEYCGACDSCFEKICYLYSIGLKDLSFTDNKIIKKYKKEIKKKDFDENKKEIIVNYLLRDDE